MTYATIESQRVLIGNTEMPHYRTVVYEGETNVIFTGPWRINHKSAETDGRTALAEINDPL